MMFHEELMFLIQSHLPLLVIFRVVLKKGAMGEGMCKEDFAGGNLPSMIEMV